MDGILISRWLQRPVDKIQVRPEIRRAIVPTTDTRGVGFIVQKIILVCDSGPTPHVAGLTWNTLLYYLACSQVDGTVLGDFLRFQNCGANTPKAAAENRRKQRQMSQDIDSP